MVLTVVGARPQFIKAAPVSRAIARSSILREVMVHTGQHFDADMSMTFFEELAIPEPAHNLGIHGGGHGEMTGRMLAALEAVLIRDAPAAVLVYGDTNSTLAAGLVAAKMRIPVVHVEAGLRSFNRAMPEEINRVLVDHVSTLLFCPTRAAVANLAHEGITGGVHHVGDVMYDACLLASHQAKVRSAILERLGLTAGAYAVATVHRAENTDSPEALSAVLSYLREQAEERQVVLPLHPRTRAAAKAFGLEFSGLTICPPLGYLDMTRLVSQASIILTDSGGLQKEAYFAGVPCVTLRGETEWIETIDAGWNRLWTAAGYKPQRSIADYGTGDSAQRIVTLIEASLA